MTFKEALLEGAKDLGITNQQLATELQVPLRTLEHWLSGDRTPLDLTQDAILLRMLLLQNECVMVMLGPNGELQFMAGIGEKSHA